MNSSLHPDQPGSPLPTDPVHDQLAKPLISIGLPVYNGAEHLRESIESLLAQDIGDFELIISDNASTDDTARICLEYAAGDSRVRYSRNDTNIGGAANYNRVFELSGGEFFMWGSDDDIWDPRFARMCIARLRESPNAAMCTSQAAIISYGGDLEPERRCDGLDTEGMPPAARVHEVFRRLWGADIYGVIRPRALAGTRLFLPTFGPDTRLLLELVLIGDIVSVPETLFFNRMPEVQKTAAQYIAEVDPRRSGQTGHEDVCEPLSYLARELLQVVRQSDLDESTILGIERDMVETLSFQNLFWRGLIFGEQGISLGAILTPAATRAAVRSALRLPEPIAHPEVGLLPYRPWRMHAGMGFPWARRVLLRLMAPFSDPQNEMDAEHTESIAALTHEVRWLRSRVKELERRQARDS
jgi:hypothetical protein